MKSIWIVKQYGSTPDLPGGVRQYYLARSLAKRGFKVAFFLSRFHYLLHQDLMPGSNSGFNIEVKDGIQLVWIKSFKYLQNDLRRLFNIVHFAANLYFTASRIVSRESKISPPDFIIANNVPLLAPWCAYLLSKRFAARFILELGDLWPQSLIDLGKIKDSRLPAKVLRGLETFLYSRANHIISPLPQINQYLNKRGFGNKCVGFETGEEVLSYSLAADGDLKPENGFTVMYVGAHGPVNNLMIALDAFKLIATNGRSDIRLILVGDGADKKDLREYASKKKLTNVEFLDPVPKNDVPRLLQRADALLLSLKPLPVYRYGISLNKMADYLCAGKPIILAGAVPNNIIDDIKCGVTAPPNDPKALAETIVGLSLLPMEKREEMGRAGRKYAEKRFDIEKAVDRLIRELTLEGC